MSGRHPRDELGRVLPHAWWPDDRQAPGELEFVRRFCNSINRENGAERFATSVALDRWLATEGRAPAHASRGEVLADVGLTDQDIARQVTGWVAALGSAVSEHEVSQHLD